MYEYSKDLVDVLLVEDDVNDAELTMLELRKNSNVMNITHLKNGDEAIKYFFYDDGNIKDFAFPKVVLLDLQLPKVSGLDVLKSLKSNELTKQILVIIMTSSKEEMDLYNCYQNGANSYIVKPIDFDVFCQRVSEIGSYWMSANAQPKLNLKSQE
ncbi:response regulator [Aliikangiella sp. IMCC44653]